MAIALTSLGTSVFAADTSYLCPDGVTRSTRFPATAAFMWAGTIGGVVDVVHVVATRDAVAANHAAFVADLNAAFARVVPTEVHVVDVADIAGHEAVVAALEGELLLDVTNGFRIQPLLLALLAARAEAAGKLQLASTTYGLQRNNGEGDVVDLRRFLELPRWMLHRRAFETTGRTDGIVDELKALERVLKKAKPPALSQTKQRLELVGAAHAAGLAVDAIAVDVMGFTPRAVRDALAPLLPGSEPGALIEDALGFVDLAAGVKVRDQPLALAIIEKLCGVVDAALRRGAANDALRIGREVLVSRVMLAGAGAGSWVDYKARHAWDVALGQAARRREHAAFAGFPLLPHIQSWMSSRNKVAHGGFCDASINTLQLLKEARTTWAQLRPVVLDAAHPLWSAVAALTQVPPAPDVVVTPLGTSPGILFTLLHALDDADASPTLIVLGNETAFVGIDHAVRAFNDAGKKRAPTIRRVVVDVFDWTRRDDMKSAAWGEARGLLSAASSVWLNLTGGTTRTAWLAERLVSSSDVIGLRRTALVDKRAPEVQRQDPWARGTVVFVDDD